MGVAAAALGKTDQISKQFGSAGNSDERHVPCMALLDDTARSP